MAGDLSTKGAKYDSPGYSSPNGAIFDSPGQRPGFGKSFFIEP